MATSLKLSDVYARQAARGHRLRRLRQLAGKTQIEISHVTPVSPSRLSLAETGRIELADLEFAEVERVLLGMIEERMAALHSELSQSVSQEAAPLDTA